MLLQENKVDDFHAKTLDYLLFAITLPYKRQKQSKCGKNHALSDSYKHFVSFDSNSAFTIRKSRLIFGLLYKIVVQTHRLKMVKNCTN